MSNVRALAAKAFTTLHRLTFQTTGGRIGGQGFGMPVVCLTTTGRKSGKKRQTMLTSPIQVDDTYVLVASAGGSDRNPAWFLNLRDDPDVELQVRGSTRKMTARVATAEERAELWSRIVEQYPGYGNYQTKTRREIPLALIEPK